MIDWSKIADEKTFQRLVNHLFALECNSPSFIPSSPYIGADGGWDGYYEGYYPLEETEGIYSIQSKWTSQSFTKAVRHLKKEIIKELKNTKSKNVDHLRIATNAELKPEDVIKLKLLNKDDIKSLEVWHRENLTIRIERQPFVRHFFFGDPQHIVFIPWNIYFEKLELHLTPLSSKEIPKFKEYLNGIKKFLLSNQSHLLMIHAPGGYGKSHLLREVAQNAHEVNSTRQTWLVRAGFRRIEDAIQEEILSDRQYVLIFDDVDRNFDDVKPLLAFLRSGSVDLKLILALRSSGIHLLRQTIRESKCSEISEELRIADWTKDELIKLLELTAGKAKVNDEEKIVRYYPNPYLIVLIGDQLKGKIIRDFSSLKNKLKDDIIYDTQKCLNDIFNRELENFLFVFASVIPFSFESKLLLEKICADFNIPLDLLKQIINRLLDAGILRYVGRTIRFNPDMKGDIYLLYKIKDFDKEFLKRFISEWMSICPENLFINIGAAFKYEEANFVKDTLVDLLNQWAEEAHKTPGSERKRILGLVEKIAYLVPECVGNLLLSYFETPIPDETQPIYRAAGLGKFKITTDDYGPVIYELIKIASFRHKVVTIIERLAILDISGTYSNYKPANLIRECVSPLRYNIDEILSTLDFITSWLDKPDQTRIKLLNSVLSEILAGTHEFSHSYLDKFIFGERPLIKHPKVINLRMKALNILKKMVSHDTLDVQIEGINIAENIGRTTTGRFSEQELPLVEIFKTERKELIEDIGKLIDSNTDFRLLSKIEDLFINWWAQEKPGAENVDHYLRKFPRTPEYLIFRYFVSKDDYIENFSEIEARAPLKGKWGWFVDEVMNKKWEMKPENFLRIVEEVNKKYRTESEILNFLNDLDRKLSSCETYSRALFLIQWVKANPTIFSAIQDNANLWSKVPKRFEEEIETTLIQVYPQRLTNMAGEILKGKVITPDKVSRAKIFLWLLPEDLSQDSIGWIENLIEKGGLEIRSELIYKFYYVFKKTNNIDLILDFILRILSKERELNKGLLNNIYFLIHRVCGEMDRVQSKKEMFRKKLLEMLKNYSPLSWHAQEILERCAENIEEIIDFIEYRLNKAKVARDRKEFEAIPFDGIRCLDEKIYSFDDYWKFIQKIIHWYKYDVFWKNFETKYLMSSIVFLQDKNTNEIYLIKCIQKLLQESLLEEASICATFLPLRPETIDVFVEFSDKGIVFGQYEKVKAVLFSKTWPEEVLSSKIGESPPVFLTIKNTFIEMNKKAVSGRLKTLINKCIEIVEKEIEDHIKRNEEFLIPKN